MFISRQDARSIVEEVKTAIGRDINIMDETGRILAGTNPARQGQLHPGAERILRSMVFSSCTDQEREAFSQLVRLYFQEDGDIRRCAERLFIHRNTFQYRTEALRRRTGYDLRRPKDATLLCLASLEL